MASTVRKAAPAVFVVLAFATVYLVWGSTYFFIQRSVAHIPAMLVGMFRFLLAGILLLLWCVVKGERIWDAKLIRTAAVTGFLLLFIGNGAVIWAEKTLPSSLAAVLVSSAPLWFVLLDFPKWKENLSSRRTILGLVIGFAGVVLLFANQMMEAFSSAGNKAELIGLIILIVGSISWSGGSLYSKYKSSGSATVNTAWQMLAGGLAFLPASLVTNEWSGFHWRSVPFDSWFALFYLVVFGSLLAYSAYVWLLQVRPATQVSTYAYVNPVVAVLLGVFFAHENIGVLQVAGLVVILSSVLLINLSKYRKLASRNTLATKESGTLHPAEEKIA